jgi:hypothetical protein
MFQFLLVVLTSSTFMFIETICCLAGMPAALSKAVRSVDFGLQKPTPSRRTFEAGKLSEPSRE